MKRQKDYRNRLNEEYWISTSKYCMSFNHRLGLVMGFLNVSKCCDGDVVTSHHHTSQEMVPWARLQHPGSNPAALCSHLSLRHRSGQERLHLLCGRNHDPKGGQERHHLHAAREQRPDLCTTPDLRHQHAHKTGKTETEVNSRQERLMS